MQQGYVFTKRALICAFALALLPVMASADSFQLDKIPAPKQSKASSIMEITDFKYTPRVSAGPFYQSHSNSFGFLDLFVPYTFNPHSILFFDGRFIGRGISREFNAALGVRNITPNGNYLWTLYAFYDYRLTQYSNAFSQVTLGFDFQTEKWYLNGNGYIPVGKTTGFVDQFNTSFLCQGNTRICYARGLEKSMGGADIEIGRDFFHDLRLYVGGYVFARSDVTTAAGPKIRFQYNIQHRDQRRVLNLFDKIALLAEWRDDNLVGSSWYAGVRFDISIGPTQAYIGLERKMKSLVKRDINIEVSSDGVGSKAVLTQPIRILTNDFNGQETQVVLSTSASVVADAANSRNNIIGVRGVLTPGANIVPSTNQYLEGGVYSFVRENTNFSVQVGNGGGFTLGANSIDVASAATVGQNVTIENLQLVSSAAAGAITTITSAANSVGVLGVFNNSATGSGNFVVLAPTGATTDSVNITGNTVTGANTSPISITGSTNAGGSLSASISRNSITTAGAVGDRGIVIVGQAGATTIEITRNTVATSGTGTNASVSLVGTAGTVTVAGDFYNNTLTDSAATGRALFAIDNVTFNSDIRNNTFTGTTVGTGGVVSFQANLAGSTVSVAGAFQDNTLTDLSAANADRIIALNDSTAGNANKTITITGGILSNTLVSNGGTAGGLYTETTNAADNVTIATGFSSNTFTNVGAATGILLNETVASIGTTTVTIGLAGDGNEAALAAANGLTAAQVPETGNGTVTINP